jgi:hypothetical protein
MRQIKNNLVVPMKNFISHFPISIFCREKIVISITYFNMETVNNFLVSVIAIKLFFLCFKDKKD